MLAIAACGRLGFGDAADAVVVGPEVVAELGDVYSYDAADFLDTNGTLADNAFDAMCPLGPPFAEAFAIIAGRAVIAVGADGTATARDYRSPLPEMGGPDALVDCLFDGTRLWLGGASQGAGDGLYVVEASWAITRDNTANNIGLMLVDDGTFTGAARELVFESDGDLYARPLVALLDVSRRIPQAVRSSSGPLVAVGRFMPDDTLEILDPTTFTGRELLRSSIPPELAHGVAAPAPILAYALIDEQRLVAVGVDGVLTELAIAPSLDDRWYALANPGDGALYLVESNRALPRHRILRLAL